MSDETPWWHEGQRDEPTAGADALGDAAKEAAKLFEVLRDRMLTDPNTMRAGMKMMEAFTILRGSTGGGVAPGQAPECAYCPVCQAIARARNLSPESVERLTGAAMEFAETIRQTVGVVPDDVEPEVRHVPLDDDDDAAADEEPAADDFAGWPTPVDVEDVAPVDDADDADDRE